MTRPVTAVMAADVCEMLNLPAVSPSTIRTWAERGKVKKYGRDQFGHQKYELTDIIAQLAPEQAQKRHDALRSAHELMTSTPVHPNGQAAPF